MHPKALRPYSIHTERNPQCPVPSYAYGHYNFLYPAVRVHVAVVVRPNGGGGETVRNPRGNAENTDIAAIRNVSLSGRPHSAQETVDTDNIYRERETE